MTPQPPEQEWIISDKDYHIALEYFHLEARPLSDELKKERERVLDELLEWNEHDRSITEIMITRSHEWWHRRFKETIESLRGEPLKDITVGNSGGNR